MKISNRRNEKLLMALLLGGIFFFTLFFLPSPASATTNISATTNQHWAWNDVVGWIDFYIGGTSNITVSASQLTYSASSSVGYLSLDCGTAPGWTCSPISYNVANDGAGNLGGWAWNDQVGWITFYWGNASASSTQAHTSLCTSYGQYCGVYIDASGNFHGYAWSDAVGWISFNCLDISAPFCSGTSNYEVATSWAPVAAVGTLDSATFDTASTPGAELNSVMWHGSLNGLAPGAVAFQFAASSSPNGPWSFVGPDGTASSTYIGSGNPDTPIPIYNYAIYAGLRYFRYRVILTTNSSQSISPKVTGISVDWSP